MPLATSSRGGKLKNMSLRLPGWLAGFPGVVRAGKRQLGEAGAGHLLRVLFGRAAAANGTGACPHEPLPFALNNTLAGRAWLSSARRAVAIVLEHSRAREDTRPLPQTRAPNFSHAGLLPCFELSLPLKMFLSCLK